MKIVHICPIDKFIPSFVDCVNNNFNSEEHVFWIFGRSDIFDIKDNHNVKYIGASKFAKLKTITELIIDANKSDKVIFHSFLGAKLAAIFFFMPWIMSKCYWFIWGGDLYSFKAKRNLRWYLKEAFRRPVIKRMGYLVTYVQGDYELAKEWYGCKGHFLECLMYTSNVYNHVELDKKNNDETVMILGNSADPTNNHIDALKRIEIFKDENIRVIVPLSYGDKKYAVKVIAEGQRLLGAKFQPITDFMPYEKYLELLSTVDVAIFNHDRQQAMGNTISLLGLKKTVFINRNTTQWRLFEAKGIKVLDMREFTLEYIDDEQKKVNSERIKEYFSHENLIKQLKVIFDL
ncbi:TDP-N-acetylfucosamine:lipid II N-acetylfucosaminyltransferase [Serratia fonticola]|uniref:TDP-N-acetylfucosamine:lipid II N-acetylfucosaminyltransferase n=1 Tax=Serratia fonticola TaxID=47917 RepID=UPI0015C5F0E3|nr:TDP-N-acetylfucosamine:lipid II N-acetylfucosaminyltransferase [Serratia fonticola]MBC3380906.1 TDP-N-acetylfucosamine:lipid II N-acetylfucosaminyltransferase [Serratia fonticola]NYA40105.1 TDP-N-acetylfucosamine:lipid II N-acetylfucosaminyltransferase [Serratia fonticola]